MFVEATYDKSFGYVMPFLIYDHVLTIPLNCSFGKLILQMLGHGLENDNHNNYEGIKTLAYILTYTKFIIPEEMKIGYCREKVENFIPASVRYFKYQKY